MQDYGGKKVEHIKETGGLPTPISVYIVSLIVVM